MAEELLNVDGEKEVSEETEEKEETEAVEAKEGVDGKSEDDKTGEGEIDKDDVKGAPDSYKAFEMPEGVEVDKDLVDQFSPIAKEIDLSQASAQKLVSFFAGLRKAETETLQSDWSTKQDEWKKEVKADKELGGKDFEKNLGIANGFLKKYGTPELSKALGAMGVANHPEFVRLFLRAGKAIEDDTIISGNTSGSKAKLSPEQILFPSMN